MYYCHIICHMINKQCSESCQHGKPNPPSGERCAQTFGRALKFKESKKSPCTRCVSTCRHRSRICSTATTALTPAALNLRSPSKLQLQRPRPLDFLVARSCTQATLSCRVRARSKLRRSASETNAGYQTLRLSLETSPETST